MFDLILFDLDGTLTDSQEGITKCVQYALSACGIEENDPERLMAFVGPPLIDSFIEFYDLDKDKALYAVEKYRERFRDVGIFENRIFDGAAQMLKTLKASGKKIALATSKPRVFAERILDYFDIASYFDVVMGAELDGRFNEKEAVIEEVLRRCPKAISPVMVGDRCYDVEGAHTCGIPCVAVRFGYAKPGELERAKADWIVEDMQKLSEFLCKKNT